MDGDGVTTRLWRDGVLVEKNVPLEDVPRHLDVDGSLLWVDVSDPTHATLFRLAEDLGLDPHAVEDAVAHGERPKATRHASHTFVVAYATSLDGSMGDPAPDPGATTDPAAPAYRASRARPAPTRLSQSRLRLTRISAFVLPRGLVTVQTRAGFDMAEVVERWEEDPELLALGPGTLLHGLLDALVDGHFDTVQRLDDDIEDLESRLFDGDAVSRETQQLTFRLRKELVQLRRVVLPMREVVNTVLRHRAELGHEGTALDAEFTDLYDHVLRATEWTESLRDMVTTVFETTLSLQDARLNTIMKKLTGWAAIIAVPTAITGWFGQNVPYPGFGRPVGVWLATASIVLVSLALYALFRRRDWL
ncbi:MAG TPA: magnesium transporter CorA family protein [Dermatophilaceae bacterium]|nr:magnesium transporter CorA family protein [Dermatophilaceae bacterium]